jgi:hypothetical protein
MATTLISDRMGRCTRLATIILFIMEVQSSVVGLQSSAQRAASSFWLLAIALGIRY